MSKPTIYAVVGYDFFGHFNLICHSADEAVAKAKAIFDRSSATGFRTDGLEAIRLDADDNLTTLWPA